MNELEKSWSYSAWEPYAVCDFKLGYRIQTDGADDVIIFSSFAAHLALNQLWAAYNIKLPSLPTKCLQENKHAQRAPRWPQFKLYSTRG